MFTDVQLQHLRAPLDERRVSARTVSGRSVSYLEAWDCIHKANEIFGFEGWSQEITRLQETAGGFMASVRLTVSCGYGTVSREDTGFTAFASRKGRAAQRRQLRHGRQGRGQ